MDKVLLAKYAKFDVTLDNSQHNEMCKIATELDNSYGDQLEAVYKEASDSEGVLQYIWIANSGLSFTRVKQKWCALFCHEELFCL